MAYSHSKWVLSFCLYVNRIMQ